MKKHHRWFIAAFLFILCFSSCATHLSRVPEDFTSRYIKADFSAMNSPADENGLGDTKIYLECRISDFEIIGGSIACVAEDSDKNKWLILLEEEKNALLEHYKEYENKEIVLCGRYLGYSEVKKMPSITLVKFCEISSGNIVHGMLYAVENAIENGTAKEDAEIVADLENKIIAGDLKYNNVYKEGDTIYIIMPTVEDALLYLTIGDKNFLDLWNQLCELMCKLSANEKIELNKIGRSDLHICVEIVDEDGITLYSARDGKEMLNATTVISN